MKLFLRSIAIPLIIFTLVLVVSFIVYPTLPNQMTSHWGISGEPDGYMGRFWGTFLLPIIMLVVFLIMVVVPHIDPKKRNIEVVRGAYDATLIILMIFFTILQGFVLGVNSGYVIDGARFFPALFGFLFFALGFVIERVKQNWTIGLRNPWTLSNEYVWDKTHAIGGKVFKICGVIASLGIFYPSIAFPLFLTPLLIGIIGVTAYSYILYRRKNGEEKQNNTI